MADRKSSFELLEQIEKLKDAAYRDSLTGVFNRRAAEIHVESALAQMRAGESCMMMIIDLDNFKKVNDTLGHQTGDQVICTTAETLSGLFRPGDIVARLGGDEYIVFLRGNITRELAESKGKQICDNLQLTVGDEKKIFVSSSVGIFLSDGSCTSFREMYRRADAALYQAKNNGKNQFYISEDASMVGDGAEREASHPLFFRRDNDETSPTYNSLAVVECGESGRLIYADTAFCRMLGIDEEELEGQSILDYIHPDDTAMFCTIAEHVETKAGVSVQIRLRSLFGEWIYSKVNLVLIEYENGRCILLKLANMLQTDQNPSQKKQSSEMSGEDLTRDAWEVDWVMRTFRFFDYTHNFQDVQGEECVFPYDLIKSGWISPESASGFIRFATNIFTGRVSGHGNFLVRSEDGLEYNWATLSYRIQGDSRGVPRRIVGEMHLLDATLQVERIPFARKSTIPVPAIDGMVVKLDANVNQDSVEKVWIEGSSGEEEIQNKKLSYFIVSESRRIYDRSDKVDFINFLSKDNLTNCYEHGNYWYFTKYRRIDRDGYIEWVSLAMNLYQRTLDDDIKIRLRINNCDDRHVWECYSSHEFVRRKETSRYPMSYIQDMIQGLSKEAVREVCAAVLIRADGMELAFGDDQEKMNSVREYISNTLAYALGTRCVSAKADDEHDLFFFPDICSASHLNSTLEAAVNYSRQLLSDVMPAHNMRFSLSVCYTQLKDADFDHMLLLCRQQMTEIKGAKTDKIIFCQDEKKEKETGSRTDFLKKTSVLDESDQLLSEKDKGVFTQCLSDMLLASSADKGLQMLFQRLGDHYQADRIYILSMKDVNRDLDVVCEWKLPHLETISIYLAKTSIDKLQLLTRCSIEKKPLRYCAGPFVESESEEGILPDWSYCIFPLCMSDSAYTVTDFLCMENPKNDGNGFGLINQLLPYIKNQKVKSPFYAESLTDLHKSVLDGLPNLMAYVYMIPNILAHKYKSMGVYLAKISRLSFLNSHHGFDYGNDMLRYIADTFAEVLGEQYLYRTWDNEFLALIPDISREEAEEKYRSIKVKFEGRYGEHIFINHRWKSENFTSRELMDMPKSGIRGSIIDVEKYLKMQVSDPLEVYEEIPEQCELAVYVQPVFDVQENRLVGAELLVRGIGSNGEVVLPHQFLRRMEHNHSIKNVDLFVMEEALKLMDRWQKRGLDPISVSINFSKDTILDSTILASCLAVRSRYPHLEDARIGIEIPQDLREEHYGKLAPVMEQLREFGASFSLDNMGVDREDEKFLSQVRFDAAKIDQSLMVDVSSSESTRKIVRAIVSSCMEKKICCVAEGIETREQLEHIQKLGCRYAQGYYFDMPMPVDEFDRKYMSGEDRLQMNENVFSSYNGGGNQVTYIRKYLL